MYPFRYRTAEIAFTLQGLTSLISALKKIPTSKGNCIVYIFFSFLFFLWRPFLFHVECWGNSKSTNLEAAYFLVSPFGWADSRRFRPNWTQFARRASSVHRFTTTTGLRCIFNQRNLIEEEGQTKKRNLLKQREEEVWVSFSIILHKLSAMAGTCDEFLLLITLACVPAVCVCVPSENGPGWQQECRPHRWNTFILCWSVFLISILCACGSLSVRHPFGRESYTQYAIDMDSTRLSWAYVCVISTLYIWDAPGVASR